jgi:hypothetical protein
MLGPKMRTVVPWLLASGMALVAAGLLPQSSQDPSPVELHFRLPAPAAFRAQRVLDPSLARARWLAAWTADGASSPVEFGDRVVVGVEPGHAGAAALREAVWPLARTVADGWVILQAPDAWAAAQEADRLARLPAVRVCYPVLRRPARKLGAYAARPNDPFFQEEFFFENRDGGGQRVGADLNARGAWPVTRGEGTVIAVADDGIELSHPEFVRRADNGLHFNFTTFTTNGLPLANTNDDHGTAVAGLALAEQANGVGVSGLAPLAQPASWKIFDGDNFKVTDEGMMDLYQHDSNVVSVQNHSWGYDSRELRALTPLEDLGISNAVTSGRQGRGVVLVRAGGNGREWAGNANDDGAANDPRSVAVAATGQDGRVASYSSRGACLLVAAPGGDIDRGVFTTDRQGSLGYNSDLGNNPDYAFDAGMMGTSFSCPQVAGLAALILSANPELTYRDVQQILVLSSRHFDLKDPDLQTNGAGLRVSHNVGYGIPDAGEAVRLARGWAPRPPAVTRTFRDDTSRVIPESGLQLHLVGPELPPDLAAIPASPSWGPHPDAPTAALPLVDVGLATEEITQDLTGKAAFMQSGVDTFADKIERAARAGAGFVVMVLDPAADDGEERWGTDFVPIPAVMIESIPGHQLQDYLLSHPDHQAWLDLDSATCTFTVSEALLCEHVGIRLRSDHTSRGDLRITLRSPAGTRSVLQHLNSDDSPGPADWTYWSVHHFLEASAGVWTLAVTDEAPLDTGSVLEAELLIRGVALLDTDGDGLDDAWELARFGSLAKGPTDDPDGDGFNNAREQLMGTDPNAVDVPFRVDFSPWDESVVRLSWPGSAVRTYEIWAGTDAGAPLTLVTALPGNCPETEWLTSRTSLTQQFFRVRAVGP